MIDGHYAVHDEDNIVSHSKIDRRLMKMDAFIQFFPAEII